MTLGALYQALRKSLREGGMETPDLDARLLLAHALGVAPSDVVLKPETPARMTAQLQDAINRRLRHEPVAKITGTREFYGLAFRVTRDVLDPRPDTETLVDAARPYIKPGARLLDVCTGSGCILITLLSLFPGAEGVGVDISAPALDVARENARAHAVESRARFVQGNYLESIAGHFDVIACNPPYIESAAIESLAPDVRDYDPHLALDGGEDGLSPYRLLFPQIRACLAPGGVALFEFGAGQGGDVARLAALCGLQLVSMHRDLGGHERVAVLQAGAAS